MHSRAAQSVLLASALMLWACPPTNSQPCAADSECRADQRCRRGACGPICLDDSECGDAQVCRSGVCAARPECAQDTDCAGGFECKADRCQCLADTSCAANQQCLNGTCTTRKRCTSDSECAGSGGRCEVTQGLCLPVCVLPQDCAPNLDPQVAFALYTCVQGTCTRRCTADLQCGGAGFVCVNNLCKAADCTTMTDCPAGQYCTNATFGRCLAYQVCTSASQCARNFECKKFDQLTCPPGFDCSQKICQELPRCLVDGDCLSTPAPGQPVTQNGYCFEGHCQPAATCTTGGTCASGTICIGGVCVPSVCRGHADCGGAGRYCVDGACVTEPLPGDVVQLKVTPAKALLEVGDTLQLQLTGYRLDGSSSPLSQAVFTVVDELGAPSTGATVSPAGLVTAVTAGKVIVRVTLTGSVLAAVPATITIYPVVTTGRRVLVVDAATRTPLSGVKVMGCEDSSCTTPAELVTDTAGVAQFAALGAGAATFTAVAQDVRSDGLPGHERASVLGTLARDVYLPLRDNPVESAAGFNGTISFTDVSTTGSYWAGIIATSVSDLPSLSVEQLTGQPFQTQVPGINQSIPIPGAVVLYTSPAFGIPQQIKGRSLGLSDPGTRFTVAFAGRANLDATLALRSTDFLGYLGAYDYALDTGLVTLSRVQVPDTSDINGNGLCSSPTRCPMGSENVPDYVNFPRLSFQPKRQQQLRTEVVVPNVPSTFDQVVIAAVELDPQAGMLPVGFASRTAGAPGNDGTRPVDPVTLRSGPPYGGMEIATPGVWALAGSANGTSVSGRLTRTPLIPPRVLVQPFLPVPANGTFNPVTRTFSPGQPEWASVYSTGGELARVAITGTEQRHTIYFALEGGQTTVRIPPTPTGPGTDPTGQAGARLEVVAIDLDGAFSVDDLYTLRQLNLSSWVMGIDGYARFQR